MHVPHLPARLRCGSAHSCAAPGTRRRPSRRRSRDTSPAPAARPRCRRSSARQSPCRRCTASPRGNADRAGAAPPRRRTSMRSCSSLLCSGVVIETSSTLVNWCWRIMPRVSLPAAPASARKHGVSAVNRIGSSASSTIDSRTRLVSGTSAVGMSQKSSSGARSCDAINEASSEVDLRAEFCSSSRWHSKLRQHLAAISFGARN